MSRFHCRLITELIAFKKAEGGTIRDLARELGVDETALIRYRSGARRPSKLVLVKIATRFGQQTFVRDLVWHHLTAECNAVSKSVDGFGDADLPPRVEAELRTYVERFAHDSVRAGRGLYLVSSDTRSLSAALRALSRSFEADRVLMQVLRGDQTPNARALRAALAAAVVIVERADFASEAIRDIILRRADLLRPTIVTSVVPPEEITNAYLRRVALSTMRLVQLSPETSAPSSSTAAGVHDAA